MVYREEAAMDDFCGLIGTAIRNRVDVRAVVDRYFPSHDAFAAWRDADSRVADLLETRDDLADALIEIGLRRGGSHVGSSEGVLEFDNHIDAQRFRDWCRPE
jgi:hypothetical protein